jgi:hypothetical protein
MGFMNKAREILAMDFDADIKGKNFERGIIKDKVMEYYDRLDITVESVEVEYRSLNHYEVTVTYVDRKLGTVVAHYTVLLKDGTRVEFQ